MYLPFPLVPSPSKHTSFFVNFITGRPWEFCRLHGIQWNWGNHRLGKCDSSCSRQGSSFPTTQFLVYSLNNMLESLSRNSIIYYEHGQVFSQILGDGNAHNITSLCCNNRISIGGKENFWLFQADSLAWGLAKPSQALLNSASLVH